ncbi:MAG: T9SS type A sorting domain-containing protein [Bacteroidota bacterium]
MKKTLLLLTAFFSFQFINAQITYTDYGGQGWVIPINSNTAVDVDNNGTTDFYVNGWTDELGFVPITIVGCFSSPGFSVYTEFGARVLTQHQPGEMVALTPNNEFDFIDDNRGSVYQTGLGYSQGWENDVDYYIGFVVILNGGNIRHGWMKVAFDDSNFTTIIKEMAYTEPTAYYTGSIEVGDRGTTSTGELSDVLKDITVSPNPASDFTQIEFNYSTNKKLDIRVFNTAGQYVQPVNNTLNVGVNQIRIPLDNLTTGHYLIRFENEDGFHTEQLFVNK